MFADKKNILKKKYIYFALTICFAVILIIVIFLMIYQHNKQKNAGQQLEDLVERVTTESPVTEIEIEPETEKAVTLMEQLGVVIPQKEIDWGQLLAENDDVYAWIYIPETAVDYPILQHATENNYYIEHNIDGSVGRPGCITTQVGYNGKDFMDANTCIYGHNMSNGTMFHDLHKYEENDFFEQNKYVFIYLPDGKAYAYEIFAAYTYTNELIPYKYDFTQKSEYQRYLDDIFQIDNGFFRQGMQVTTQNHMITLSTCTTPFNEKKRYLVQAVMINDPTLTDDEMIQSVYPTEVNKSE